MPTAIQTLLARAIGAPDLKLTLKSGKEFQGKLHRLEEGIAALTLRSGEQAAIDTAEIAAIIFPASLPPPSTQARVEYAWENDPPGAAETAAANELLQNIIQALAALHAESQIERIVLISGNAGRFRVTGPDLEAGFVADEAPLPANELKSLLAAIL